MTAPLYQWTEVAPNLSSLVVAGGTIYRDDRSRARLLFVPFVQQLGATMQAFPAGGPWVLQAPNFGGLQ